MALAWPQTARDDLSRIRAYFAQYHPLAACRTGERIVETSRRLIDRPRIGPPGRQLGTHEIVVRGTPYLIVYRLGSKAIEILRVLHGRQDWPDTDP